MKYAFILLFIAIVFLIILLTQPRLRANPESIIEIEKYIHKIVSISKPPGLSIVVLKDGRIAYSHAFGWADGPDQLSASPDTIYHWWSMTKIPTAVAILQLHDAQKLNIDDPISDYLPFFKVELDGEPAPPITIRQVLRHTSGLQDTIPAMIGWVHYEDEIYNQTALLQEHLPKYTELKFSADSRVAYSNLGYMVLGAIIEKVSGKPYEDYIKECILTPLGMKNTGFLYSSQMSGKIAAGSHPIASIYSPLLPFLLDMKILVKERNGSIYWFNRMYLDVTPPSGLIGSAHEAALLAQALLSKDELLSPESHLLLRPEGSNPTERPLGWAEFNTADRVWVQHSGGGPGFATIMRLYPKEGLGIVIMSNSTNLPREKLVDAFASLEW